jgi:hypothetical protein
MAHDRAAKPFFFRANSGECIVFEATNPIPKDFRNDGYWV